MNSSKQSKVETKKVNKDSSQIRHIAFENFKKGHNGFSTPLLVFALFSIASLSLLIFLPSSFILTVPLVVLPSLLAFIVFNTLKEKKEISDLSYQKVFRSYFTRFFFSGFRILVGFVKFALVYILTSALFITIFEFSYLNNNEAFQQILKNYEGSTDIQGFAKEIETFLSSNSDLYFLMQIAVTVGSILGAIVLINHIVKNSMKLRYNILSKQLTDVRLLNVADRFVRKKYRGYILKSYFKSTWFINSLIILIPIGGVVASFYLLNGLEYASIIALLLMLLVALPFMNYLSEVQTALFLSLANEYEEAFVEMTLMYIDKFKSSAQLTDEERKKLDEALDFHRKSINEESNKDKKDDNKE